MDTPEVRYAWRNGRAIAYQTWGSGSVDYLMMGEWATASDALWEHPGHLRLWRFHGSFARCIRFDRSGIGSSDPADGDVGDVTAWADDAMAVLDAEGSRSTAISGEGWASHAAVAIAANHPSRVTRMVLLNGFARLLEDNDGPDGDSSDAVQAAVDQVRTTWGTGQVIANAVPRLGSDYLDFYPRYERLSASPAMAAAMTRAMFTSDVRDLLPHISCPTFVMHTGELPFVGQEHCRDLAEQISDATFLQAGADLYYQFTGEIARRYVGFLTGGDDELWADRQLAVVVFSDIVGSTQQLSRRGDREWTGILENSHDVVTREAKRFGGRVVKQTGDGHLVTFTSPGAALSAVFGIRRASHAVGATMRFGMHMGEIEVRDDGDVAGIAVHSAARIVDCAAEDQIVASGVIRELLAGTGVAFDALGSRNLKGLPGPLSLYAVRGPDSP